jgi:hypothetical protein
MTASTRTSSRTLCGAIFCRSVTWLQPRFANGGERRYRNLLVRQMVQMKNKIAMLLMEAGVSYNKQRLHQVGYFRELLAGHR